MRVQISPPRPVTHDQFPFKKESFKKLWPLHQTSFCLVSLIRKLSLFPICLTLCHSARSRRQSCRIHHPKDHPCPPGKARLKRWVRAGEELFPSPLILHIEHPFLWEKVSHAFIKQWILQLRASPACRMTWELGNRMEEKTSSLMCSVKNRTI